MAKSKLYWEEQRKRGEKEGKKRERKRKKGEKRGVGEGNKSKSKAKRSKTKQQQQQKKKPTGEYLLILYFKSLDSPGTCPSRWSSGGGACCADFQVLALGGAALPLPGAGLSGGCLPREAAGGTTPVAAAALEPWSQLPQ